MAQKSNKIKVILIQSIEMIENIYRVNRKMIGRGKYFNMINSSTRINEIYRAYKKDTHVITQK